MSIHDKTSMGGRGESFETTRWTEIVSARAGDDDRRREALDRILARYWKPVYCWLRRKGYGNEAAKDLTQGFFHEVVVKRGLVAKADRARGRFRAFLLTALRRYATSVHRAETAGKRMPEGGLVRLDGIDSPDLLQPADDVTPEAAFDRAWAVALLDQVLAEVQRECLADGKAAYWAVFHGRVARPIIEGTDPTPLPDLCAAHGIASAAEASNMVVTVKRRFRACLERHMRPLVESDDDVAAEIEDLIAALSYGGK